MDCRKPLNNNALRSSNGIMPSAKSRQTPAVRFGTALIAIICAGILVVAALIKPDPSGVGSHKQLGMQACGFYERTGYPCPTCGMTTAFSNVVRGRLIEAFTVQPAGALAALACLVISLVAGYMAIVGQFPDKYMNFLFWVESHMVTSVLICIGVVMVGWLWLCVLTYFTH